MSFAGQVRELLALLDRRQRVRFALLAGHSAINALLEALAALFVLALVNSVADSTARATDPVGSAIRDVLGPSASDDRVRLTIAVATLAFYVVKNLSAAIEAYVQQRLVQQAAAEASTAIVARYLHVPMAFHYQQRSGDFLRNAWTATEVVYRTSLLATVLLLSEGLAAVALVGVLLVAAPLVTPLVMVTLGGVVLGVQHLLHPRLAAWGDELNELTATSVQGVQDAFGAVRDARILGREQYFLDRYVAQRSRLARTYWRSSTATNGPRYLLETSFMVTMVLLVLLLTARETSGTDTVALFGLYGYAGLRLLPSANRALLGLGQVRLGAASTRVVTDALHVAQERPGTPGAEPLAFEHEVVLEGVTYRHPATDRPALRDVTLRIGKGETVGVVGPSGGGKSTLVDVLVGLLDPDEGRVLVDGRSIADDLAGWRERIGYVSQAVFLLDDTLVANVAFGIEPEAIDEQRVWEALEAAQLAEFVRSLPNGLATGLGQRGIRLSGGQRQRVAVARAFYRRPSLLVFDEATAALDSRTEEGLTAAIEALAVGRTVVVVAHRLSTVRMCDRLVVVVDGAVLDQGTFADLEQRSEEFRRLLRAGRR